MANLPAKVGRPTKFNENLTSKIIEWTQNGKTVEQIAELLDINPGTLRNWWRANPEFFIAIREARQVADELVEASLFRKAVGYRYTEEALSKDGPVPVQRLAHPDTTACVFWLKNRKPEEWRDRSELGVGPVGQFDEEFDAAPKSELMTVLRKRISQE